LIVQIEYEREIPRNPFIDAGAIVVADVLSAGGTSDEAVDQLLAFCRTIADDPGIYMD